MEVCGSPTISDHKNFSGENKVFCLGFKTPVPDTHSGAQDLSAHCLYHNLGLCIKDNTFYRIGTWGDSLYLCSANSMHIRIPTFVLSVSHPTWNECRLFLWSPHRFYEGEVSLTRVVSPSVCKLYCLYECSFFWGKYRVS